jgi:transposase
MSGRQSGTAGEYRRRLAMRLLEQGETAAEVARMLDVHKSNVSRWKTAYEREGENALKTKPLPGVPSKLTPQQKTRLCEILEHGAVAAGFDTDLWTCPRVRQVIWREFGVRYHVNYLGRLLKRLGYSPQLPQRQARQRDEQAEETWRRKRWPALKKGRASLAPRSSSSMRRASSCNRCGVAPGRKRGRLRGCAKRPCGGS